MNWSPYRPDYGWCGPSAVAGAAITEAEHTGGCSNAYAAHPAGTRPPLAPAEAKCVNHNRAACRGTRPGHPLSPAAHRARKLAAETYSQLPRHIHVVSTRGRVGPPGSR